jgi:Cof subfamily protein (haloacid dehalogenase superfamily)
MQSIPDRDRYRLIVFDLDGTLVDENLNTTQEDLEGIRKARQRGLAVTLATGRTFRSALPYIRKLGVALPLILCNGAAIVDPEKGEILFQQMLPAAEVLRLVEKAAEADLDCLLYTDPLSDYPTVSSLTPLLSDFILLEGLHCVELNILSEIIRRHPPIKVQIVGGDEEKLIGFQRGIAGELPGLSVLKVQSDYLEVVPAEVSKGSALHRLSRLLSIPLSQIAAFGDSVNDRELLAAAGVGIAMADASEELKEAADRIAPSVAAGLAELWS